ncbi:hypothetical protein [Streptomyces sp. ME19-01-6]|uniref:hypothetical protein n=1 Tax=Streptomyces sp. ME19-01-6 TaxID=3028686 RepID=UPI0029A89354|nr:hypothetical protein [Streptomyces sp. ME19-01-6]MDX3227624.1 hypothetical protein [Streptomyces sp. ME19-01-6]
MLQHAAGDQLGCAAFLGEGAGPAEDPFAPSGKLGDEPLAVAEAAVRVAAAAWSRVPADQEEVPVPLPSNKMPAASAQAPAPWTPPCTPGTSPSPPGSRRSTWGGGRTGRRDGRPADETAGALPRVRKPRGPALTPVNS